jgi:ATP adenylyltransferase
MNYIEGAKEAGCIFCDKPRERDSRANLVLAQTLHSVVMLNKYPYNNGHLLLAPKKHAGLFSNLSREEYADLSTGLEKAADILFKAFKPGGLNLGMNLGRCAGAGMEDHLHWHLVPRWEGDTNFMPTIAEVRVLPEHLLATYDRLSPFFSGFLAAQR